VTTGGTIPATTMTTLVTLRVTKCNMLVMSNVVAHR
jgi:hypothetical protein